MKRVIKASKYDYGKFITFDNFTEEDEITVEDAIASQIAQCWINYKNDGLTVEDAADIVIEHLEEVFGLHDGVDFDRRDIEASVAEYDWR